MAAPARAIALVVASADAGKLIAAQLRHRDLDVQLTPHHGALAAALFDGPERGDADTPVLFVLDLRASCGAAVIDARLADHDAVLNACLLAGHAWPRTLCLIETEQARPRWLEARPHFRSTLLADEVEAVIGHPHRRGWPAEFASAFDRCWSGRPAPRDDQAA